MSKGRPKTTRNFKLTDEQKGELGAYVLSRHELEDARLTFDMEGYREVSGDGPVVVRLPRRDDALIPCRADSEAFRRSWFRDFGARWRRDLIAHRAEFIVRMAFA